MPCCKNDLKNGIETRGTLNHGRWEGRTQELTRIYSSEVEASGLPKYVNFNVPAPSGFLSGLKGSSNFKAFETSLEAKKRKEQARKRK